MRSSAEWLLEEWCGGRTLCLQEAEGWCRAGVLAARAEANPQKSSHLRGVCPSMAAMRISLAGLPC